MKHTSFNLSIILSFLLSTGAAFAKNFSSKYCQFELPTGWDCALEGSEYVCQSDNVDRKKEAIIILAAKIRGEQDTLDEYMAYLNKPKEYALPGGKRQVSEAKSVKLSPIQGQQWVDALHLASEVPGFYTRYLATVKEDLGVAVTFSVQKDLYSTYQPIIEKLISTLRVFRQKKSDLSGLRSGKTDDPNYADTTFNPNAVDMSGVQKTQKRNDGGGGDDMMMIVAVVVIAAVVGIILKNRKKKGGKKKK